MDEIAQHMDVSPRQACIDLEKATQYITQVLQVRQTHTVAKRERGHSTQTRTRVYRLPNMHSDPNAKEPGLMAWQSEHTLMCSDGTSSHCPHLWEAHPCAHAHRHFLRIYQPYFSHPERSTHTSASPMGSLTQGSTYLGVIQFYRHASTDHIGRATC